jgi:hypothetical protein
MGTLAAPSSGAMGAADISPRQDFGGKTLGRLESKAAAQ